VVIPSTPDEPFLAGSLDSVLGQSLPPTRVLICINGPGARQSHSAHVAASYSPQVETLFASQASEAAALNRGIVATDTEFIAFLDADDVWHRDKQRAQVELLTSDTTLDAATCVTENFSVNSDGSVHGLNSHESALVAATTFRRRTFERFGLFDESASHFQWLYRWWTTARRNGISTASINAIGLHRRVHDNNSWTQHRSQGLKELHAELRQSLKVKRQGPSLGEAPS